ncbi:MAG: cardiolipin synthase B [Zetaproteobacteria bacterium CG12_big_fil_rev_8_21_14_0_65_54_13]|nr:MAG: cardiolipin synthase B [Zetaproteobacteria bacterium CG12_big_fil_rev_8_21_14_0_65_54_13]PIX54381.1 MAG: cardiolipin synthase B [Zetaproteobacteria bacterium CG_4_10_14_3_um_filter_54_28]PJA30717.1 MAG: cardiolipin synthase B [Zetaproteobacteria bacterium CG_4_9_14_3_um_filter_54_145]
MIERNPYPDRDGNAFRLLTGAETFLPVMELAIHRAKQFVLFEQYLISSGRVADRFIDAFIACAQRGIAVYMLIDHFGARALTRADRQRIENAGIRLLFYNPAYLRHFFRGLPRNHRKMLLIDGAQAFTGGAGISDAYQPGSARPPWHDLIVEMRGPIVADWQQAFVHTWQQWNDGIRLPATAIEPAGNQRGRLSLSLRGLHKFVRQSLLQQIESATDHIWLGTAYWLPGRRILRALRAASRRGVDVRLLLPGTINDHPAVYYAGHRYYHFLLRHNIRIFEYQPAFMHAKIYLCDSFCSLGSCNMDRWGLRWNLEANLESKDATLRAEAETFFNAAFAESREITLADWLKRPVQNRFREWLLGYLELMVERYDINRDLRQNTTEADKNR